MYKIKGQDQKEYGPVDAAQVRQWISQGRADGQTLAKPEGTAEWKPLSIFREFASAAAPPPLVASPAPAPSGDGIATIIPYRNVPALVAYYLGVFSLIPCIGFVLGIASFVFGIVGLKRARQFPEAKGKAHAWAGIILGALVFIAHVVCVILIFVAASRNTHRYNGAGWHM
jgi:hypothetical protein